MKIDIKFFLIFLTLMLYIKPNNNEYQYDYGFFYNNSLEKIFFDTNNTTDSSSNLTYSEDELLLEENIKKDYFSSAKVNKFKITYYSYQNYTISPTPLSLVKIAFNITEPDDITIKEVILDLSQNVSNKKTFPERFFDEYIINQNKTASNDGRKNRKTIIYDTFGFDIKSKNNSNFQIVKLLLVNHRKNKVNYMANLSQNVLKTYGNNSNNTFDIYLERMPEVFDLYATLELYDEHWNTTGEKVLIVTKDFENPNYRIENSNPNKTMFIISLVFIISIFIVTAIFVILKLICCFKL